MSRIGLVIDNPKRDLNGMLLTGSKLAEMGHEVFLIPMYNQFNDGMLLNLDIIVVNYLRPANIDLLKFFRKSRVKTCIMDTEGGLFSEQGSHSAESWAKRVPEFNMQNGVDHYFFWGKKVHDAYLKFSELKPEQMSISGCPRFDLCFAPYKALNYYELSDYILINTNFAACNPKFVTSEEVELNNVVKAGHSKDWAATYLHNQKETLRKTIEEIKVLLESFPTKRFLLRPHPFEGESIYRESLCQYQNLIIESKGEVFGVIANCEKLIHVGCGTAVEALLLDKPSYSLNYVMHGDYSKVNPLPAKISIALTSREDLINCINSDLKISDPIFRNQHLDRIRDYFGPLDGRNHIRVAEMVDKISKMEPNKNSTSFSLNRFLVYTINECSFNRKLVNFAAIILGTKNIEIFRCITSPLRRSKYANKTQLDFFSTHYQTISGHKIAFENARHFLPFLRMKSLQIKLESTQFKN